MTHRANWFHLHFTFCRHACSDISVTLPQEEGPKGKETPSLTATNDATGWHPGVNKNRARSKQDELRTFSSKTTWTPCLPLGSFLTS